MSIFKGKQGSYNLDNSPLAKGGEGAVFKIVNRDDVVAKIYFNPSKELEEKLTYMSNNQPDKSVLNDIAWPLDILYDGVGKFSGFIMPKMEARTELGELYKFNLDKEPILTYQHRIIIAINICRVISAVHDAGYTFGDFNPANIGVNLNNGHVGFFDTDSYHIYDKGTGKTYRCAVCLNGYVAPELIQQCKGTDYLNAPLPTFTQETDRFSLAIHIFKLLMNGFTPFNGIKDTETVSSGSPGLGNQAIERDNYCFKPGNKPQSLATPNISAFPISIQNLFTRAFIDGRRDPSKRPTADEWEKVLTNYYRNEIIQCTKDKNHFYYKGVSTCPYCKAESRYTKNLASKQGQMSFSSPINIPNQSSGRTSSSYSSQSRQSSYNNYSSYNTNNYSNNSRGSYNKSTMKFPTAIIIVLIGIVIFVGANFVRKESDERKYSVDNITVSLIEKTNVEATLNGYTYNFTFKFNNLSTEAINRLTGILIIKDFNSNDLMRSEVDISRIISANGNYDVTLTKKDYSGDMAKMLWNSSLDNLNVYFRITSLTFEDGTRKTFTSNQDVLIHKANSEYKKKEIIYAKNYDSNGSFWGDWSFDLDTPYIKEDTLYIPVVLNSDIDITWSKDSDGQGELNVTESLCSQGSNYVLWGYFEYEKQSTFAGETQNITIVVPLNDWVDFNFYEFKFYLYGAFSGCEYQTSEGALAYNLYTDSPSNPYNDRAYFELNLSVDW